MSSEIPDKASDEDMKLEQEEDLPSPEKKKKQEVQTCQICCGRRVTSNMMSCPFCLFDACIKCQQTYLLQNHVAHCMSCKKEWTREFVMSEMPRAFITGKYKVHQEHVLFERERAFLPGTQAQIEAKEEVRKRKIYLEHKIEETRELLQQYMTELNILVVNNNRRVIGSIEAEKREFIRACPANDCRGFLSTAWKCGLCDSRVCKECHEIKYKGEYEKEKEEEHKCDADLVETVKLLKKETKPCPKCGSSIFKVSGCDQMWCTQCKTAFSWETGRVVQTGNIHNPHYWEYVRQHGEEAANDEHQQNNDQANCENYMNANFHDFSRQSCRVMDHHKLWNEIRSLEMWVRMMGHVQDIELGREFAHREVDTRNEDLRVKYLTNVISEEDFRILVQRRQKKDNFNDDMRQLFDMFLTVAYDGLRGLTRKLQEVSREKSKVLQVWKEYVGEMVNLQNYFIDTVRSVCKRYVYKMPHSQVITCGAFNTETEIQDQHGRQ